MPTLHGASSPPPVTLDRTAPTALHFVLYDSALLPLCCTRTLRTRTRALPLPVLLRSVAQVCHFIILPLHIFLVRSILFRFKTLSLFTNKLWEWIPTLSPNSANLRVVRVGQHHKPPGFRWKRTPSPPKAVLCQP